VPTTPNRSTDHHTACVPGRACHRDCRAWHPPERAPAASAHTTGAADPLLLDQHRPRARILHTEPLAGDEKPSPAAPPLWEWISDWAAVTHHRERGCEVMVRGAAPRLLVGLPLPPLDGPGRCEPGLDRWTADDGPEAHRLAKAIAEAERGRRAETFETNTDRRVKRTADVLRAAFAGIAAHPSGAPQPALRRGRPKRLQELLALVLGEAPPEPEITPPESGSSPDRKHDAGHVVSWMCCTMAGLVYALGLVLLGRDRDPVSEHALGRMLPGEPVRDTRAPFASPAHVLAIAGMPMPGLGGGSCPWPQDDPRMAKRTYARIGEMKVSAAHHGSEHVRGEAAVNRTLSARAAVARAALTPYELAAVQTLRDRDLSREEKAAKLRDIAAREHAGCPPTFGVADDFPPVPDRTDDLFRRARAADRRLAAAVNRQSRAGDALAPPPPSPKPKAPRSTSPPVRLPERFRLGVAS